MNKFDRFRFGNLHKRRIVSMFAIVAFVLGVSAAILLYLGIFSERTELVRIRLSSETTGENSSVIGINLDRIPGVNRIVNPSFESFDDYSHITVTGASGHSVYLERSALSTGSIPSEGSSLKILAMDNDGVMTLRYSGTTVSEGRLGFGTLSEIEDTNGIWFSDPIVKSVLSDHTFAGLTKSGKIVLDITGNRTILREDGRFTDICLSDDAVYALTDDGRIYCSTDGSFFGLYLQGSYNDAKAEDLAIASGNAVIRYEDGSLRTVLANSDEPNPLVFNRKDPVMLTGDSGIVIADRNGRAFFSMNGIIFSELDMPEEAGEGGFIAGDSCGSGFALLKESGAVVTVSFDDEDGNVPSVSCSMVSGISEISDMEMSPDGSVYFLTDTGDMIITGKSEISRLKADSNIDDILCIGTDEKIYAMGRGILYQTSVYSEIEVDNPIAPEAVTNGDLLIFREPECGNGQGIWVVNGENTEVMLDYGNYGSGICSTAVRGYSQGMHAASIKLEGYATDNFVENTFYRLSARIMQENIKDGRVRVWLSGDKGYFGNEGMVLDDVPGSFNEYSTVFAVTEGKLRRSENIYLNISFEGEGSVYIDDIFLGEEKYDTDTMPESFIEGIKTASPGVIRLNNLNIGSDGFNRTTFYGTGAGSLESALRLTDEASSVPWLVIGPYADQKTIDDMLTYLCGPASSELGRLRADNGSAFAWNDRFDRFYIEIRDDDGVFLSDMQRGAYVSYVTKLFSQSPYYSDLKDNIVFLDGMNYDSGTVRSDADFHACPLTYDPDPSTGADDEGLRYAEFNRFAFDLYNEYASLAPRFKGRNTDGGEYISSLSRIEGDITEYPLDAASYASLLLNGNRSYIGMIMKDIDVSTRPVDSQSDNVFCGSFDYQSEKSRRKAAADTMTALRVMGTLAPSSGGQNIYVDILDPLDNGSSEKAENFSNSCYTGCVLKDGTVYLTIANPSKEQKQFVIEKGELEADYVSIRRYSSDGTLLTEKVTPGSRRRYTLGSGEYIVVSYSISKE